MWEGYAARIGTMRSYYQRSMELLDPAQRAALFCPERPVYAKENDAPPTYMDPTGQCVNSLIADGCDIQGSARNCILFRGVRVEKDAVVENCIFSKGTVVRRGAVLRHVIAGKNTSASARRSTPRGSRGLSDGAREGSRARRIQRGGNLIGS